MAHRVLQVRQERADARVTVSFHVQVETDNPEHLARAIEAFARAAGGLALEGVAVAMWAETINQTEDSTEEMP
jgi:type IV secretory pathway VirD2 relaxase